MNDELQRHRTPRPRITVRPWGCRAITFGTGLLCGTVAYLLVTLVCSRIW